LYYFSICFPTRIAKLQKFETKNICWVVGRGGSNYLNQKIHQIIIFNLKKGKNVIYIFISLKKGIFWTHFSHFIGFMDKGEKETLLKATIGVMLNFVFWLEAS
jgi:hypothetical protein